MMVSKFQFKVYLALTGIMMVSKFGIFDSIIPYVLFSGEAEKKTLGGIMPLAKSNDNNSMD